MKQLRIYNLIETYKLNSGDAIELVCPKAGFPKHYAIYLGSQNGKPYFIANIMDGVQIIKEIKLLDYMAKYEVTAIERFCGTANQLNYIIKRAVSRIGEKKYNIVFNNCEHFKNWVLYNESKSKQVLKIGAAIAATGVALSLIGIATKKKGLQKAGVVIALIPLALFLIALILASNRQNN